MPPIHILIKPASGMCNMRCTYCFYIEEMNHREQGSYGFMTEDTLEQVIKKALEFAESECTFAYQGGEPTLRGLPFFEKSILLQEKYNKKHIKINNALQTNGYAIDDKWCQFLAKHNFLIGLSIDGVKGTHDIFRKSANGEDTFFRILDSAKLLEQYKVDFNILTVVNGKTAPKIRRIYQWYEKQGFHYQQYIACLNAFGNEEKRHDYTLTPELYGQFLIDLFDMWYADLQMGRQPYIRHFENYIGILMGGSAESCAQNGICGIQNVVEANGSIYPCDFYAIDEYRLGNLNQDSFEDIYAKRKEIRFIEDSKNQGDNCLKCPYFGVCLGGCRRNRYLNEGESGHLNYFCKSYKMLFEKHLDKMIHIADDILKSQRMSR